MFGAGIASPPKSIRSHPSRSSFRRDPSGPKRKTPSADLRPAFEFRFQLYRWCTRSIVRNRKVDGSIRRLEVTRPLEVRRLLETSPLSNQGFALAAGALV